jgi:hypothetical protein
MTHDSLDTGLTESLDGEAVSDEEWEGEEAVSNGEEETTDVSGSNVQNTYPRIKPVILERRSLLTMQIQHPEGASTLRNELSRFGPESRRTSPSERPSGLSSSTIRCDIVGKLTGSPRGKELAGGFAEALRSQREIDNSTINAAKRRGTGPHIPREYLDTFQGSYPNIRLTTPFSDY